MAAELDDPRLAPLATIIRLMPELNRAPGKVDQIANNRLLAQKTEITPDR
jgi:hypothetical protein